MQTKIELSKLFATHTRGILLDIVVLIANAFVMPFLSKQIVVLFKAG